ncbi:hypothetical protein BKA62DRAFT_249195 [Auriculariales sp. MPI-PUGE-AT-0066]|nr:hypothetical protein BKA62DRAFT_249195 [Auriculariales sp. MPI-PUGE-AT-0066]
MHDHKQARSVSPVHYRDIYCKRACGCAAVAWIVACNIGASCRPSYVKLTLSRATSHGRHGHQPASRQSGAAAGLISVVQTVGVEAAGQLCRACWNLRSMGMQEAAGFSKVLIVITGTRRPFLLPRKKAPVATPGARVATFDGSNHDLCGGASAWHLAAGGPGAPGSGSKTHGNRQRCLCQEELARALRDAGAALVAAGSGWASTPLL